MRFNWARQSLDPNERRGKKAECQIPAFCLPASMVAGRLLASSFGRYLGLVLSGVAVLLGRQCFARGARPMAAVVVSHESCFAGFGLS